MTNRCSKSSYRYWYDYGKRFYDPQIGRFTCLDPIAEEYYFVTPYNYAENSPIANIDLWGLQAFSVQLTAGLEALKAKYSVMASTGTNSMVNLLVGSTTSDRIPSEVKASMSDQTLSMIDKTGMISDAANVAETVSEVSQEIVSDALNVTQTAGDVLTAVGYVAAPFTGGASLGLVVVGESMSNVAGGAKIAIAASNGDSKTMAIEGAGLLVGRGTSKLATEAIEQSVKVGTLKAGSKDAKTQSAILSAISSMFSEASKKVAEEEVKNDK